MTKEQPRSGAAQPTKKSVGRSAKPFPYADLESAKVIAEKVQEIGVDTCTREQVAASLGVGVDGGGFRARVGAASKFGLVAAKGGLLTLTDLGKKVLDPQTNKDALVDSFLAVPIFHELYQKLQNVPSPKPDAIQRQLAELGVLESQVSRARQVFLKSARYAGFYKLHPDRLMKPGRSNDTGEPLADEQSSGGEDNFEGESGRRDSANGGRGQPLLEALFATRPASDEEWDVSRWTEWLDALMPLLRMDYKDHEALRHIKVTVSQESGNTAQGGKP